MPTSINNNVDQPEKRNLKVLTNIRLKNRNRPIIGQLNINSIRNKFDLSLDLFIVSETGWPLNLEFREIREKSGNLILASKARELSGNLRKSWPKSGKKECHAFSSVN